MGERAPRGRGRPRSEEAHRAILSAADDLMLKRGVWDVSMDEIAERAGCSKSTIYRWWTSKETLALEALLIAWDSGLETVKTDTGSLRGDLRAIVRPWVTRVTEEHLTPLIAALTAEVHRNPEFGRIWQREFVERRREGDRAVFARAIKRGEISAKTDIDLALDMIFGTLYHRLLHGHKAVNPGVAYRVIDRVIAGIQPI